MTTADLNQPAPQNLRASWRRLWWVALLGGGLLWAIFQATATQDALVNPGGVTIVWQFLRAAFTPQGDAQFLWLTLDATLVTLAFAVTGTLGSLLLGTVGGLFSAEVWWEMLLPAAWRRRYPRLARLPWWTVRGVLAVPRAIHESIWGLFFVNILGLNPLVAVFGIALPFGAIVAKVFSEILDETPRQPLAALRNSGATPLQALFYGLLPQAFPNLLAYAFYRFECSIRSAAILGIIGAGGLGYQLTLSMQSLRYAEVWTLLYALFLLNGLTDIWSSQVRQALQVATRMSLTPKGGKPPAKAPPMRVAPRRAGILIGSRIAVVALVPLSFWYIEPNWQRLFSVRTGWLLVDVINDSLPPKFSADLLAQWSSLTAQTLAMSLLAMVLAAVGGLLLALGAARNLVLIGGLLSPTGGSRLRVWQSWGLLLLVRILLLVARALPTPTWALLFVFVLFPGVLPGALALGLHNLGILGRLLAETIENMDERPLRALQAQGAGSAQVVAYGVLPINWPGYLAYVLYRSEVCLRESLIVGIVGAGGLGLLLTEQLSSFDYRGVLATLIVFLLLTFAVDLGSSAIRRRVR